MSPLTRQLNTAQYAFRSTIADWLVSVAWSIAPRTGVSTRYSLPSYHIHRRSGCLTLSETLSNLSSTVNDLLRAFVATVFVKFDALRQLARKRGRAPTLSQLLARDLMRYPPMH